MAQSWTRQVSLVALLAALGAPGLVLAADAAPDKAANGGDNVSELVVTAQKLDAARAAIEPASTR